MAVPADAAAAGDKAELAWLLAFNETFFKPDTAAPPFADRVVGGLVTPAHRRRRTSSKPEVNKAGRAGLDESAAEMHRARRDVGVVSCLHLGALGLFLAR